MPQTGGRKLDVALRESAEIAEKVFNLRVILAKMTNKQRLVFTNLLKGKDEVETFILTDNMERLAFHTQFTYLKDGGSKKTQDITIKDLSNIREDSYEILKNAAKGAIDLEIGNTNYKDLLVDIQWFFQMVAPEAFQTVIEIMEDKSTKTSSKTRLAAAESILNRAGYNNTDKPKTDLPVKLVINLPGSNPTQVINETDQINSE